MSKLMSLRRLFCKNFLTFVERIVDFKVFKFIIISILQSIIFRDAHFHKNFLLLAKLTSHQSIFQEIFKISGRKIYLTVQIEYYIA